MQFLQGPIAALLSLGLLAPSSPVLAQAPSASSDQTGIHPRARAPYQSNQLQGDERILHALNRFTFGPRPGDLDAVRAMGLDKWFDQQLHPASIDQSDLNARLAQFPAMQWSTADLIYRYPSNAIIRQTMDGKLEVPRQGILHAIYENQIDRVTAKRREQEQKKAANQDPQQTAKAPAAKAMNTATMIEGDVDKTENSSPMKSDSSPARMSGNPSGQMAPAASDAASASPPIDESVVNFVLDLPPQQRIAHLAAMSQTEFDSFLKSLRPVQRVQLATGLSPEQKELVAALENPERLVAEELIAGRLTRDIYSNAQLQEVMTDFWLNHFNVYLRKNEATPYYLVSYERDVIRPHALGKFEDLLEATAHSPAMLIYLDNASSIGPDSIAAERAKDNAWRRPNAKQKAPEGLNENYARELMELHTLGVNGGYTQADVIQAARILTGWTVDQPQRGGGFEFNPNRHEPGTMKVMGQKFKDHGEQQGRELLHFLATRPATAHFISRELAERFVSDDPPQSLVDRMARSYMSSGGDIPSVLRTLFHSPEFWSTSVYRAKVKTPIEFVASAVRASNANIDNLRPVANALRQMGMPVYGCVTPNGYSWQSDAWVSTGALVDRMNFALALAANRLPGITEAWATQPAANPNFAATPAAAVTASTTESPGPEAEESSLEALLVPGGVSDSTRSAVLQQFQQQSAQQASPASDMPVAAQIRPMFRARQASALERQDQLLAGLLIGSPEFQRR
ncbi:MAG: DUF1800 domain-containing protein [Terracidiphilus sp.]